MLLRTEQLTKDYGKQRALDGLSLEVAAGEVFGLLGPNGSGKSTALRILLGFLRPTAGRAWIGGHDCWRDSVRARRLTAYLPGELRLYENMTGRQLVRFLAEVRGRPEPAESLALSRRLEIDLGRPLAGLSSGMKRKVALLLVLSSAAPLLVLDEPTNTLDPTMRDELLRQLRESRERGQAVLFSSHVLTEVERVCDRVGILQAGRLVHVQDMRQLRAGRIFQVRLSAPLVAVPEPESVHFQQHTDGTLEIAQTGRPGPLLAWLAQQPVEDLRVEPLGLSAIYHRYHGSAP